MRLTGKACTVIWFPLCTLLLDLLFIVNAGRVVPNCADPMVVLSRSNMLRPIVQVPVALAGISIVGFAVAPCHAFTRTSKWPRQCKERSSEPLTGWHGAVARDLSEHPCPRAFAFRSA